jgi:hypothetical protein
MSNVNREENVKYYLEQLDRQSAIKKKAMEKKDTREVDFLVAFAEVMSREILPAFNYYKEIDPGTFQVNPRGDSASLAITRGDAKGRVECRALPSMERVEITGARTISYLLSDVTEEAVKKTVDELLAVMASRA